MRRLPHLFSVVAAVAAVALVGAVCVGLWGTIGASQISGAGWAAMILGVVATLAVGIGLMALVFISSRRGYDELDRRSR
jgi:hypothetical protein